MEKETKELEAVQLPENAFRELKEGEEYEPVMSPSKVYPEVNSWSVIWGILMAVLFSAAAAYLGLKVGQVFEAAIPIAIIAVGASTAAKRRNALGENVIIQSIGACSGAVVAGAIFTLPAIYILQAKYPEMTTSFIKIFLASALGGILGILFLIPFRKYFVSDMHGKYPFPEATATTQVLVSGAKGGDQAKPLLLSGLVGGLYDFIVASFGWWNENFTSRVVGWGVDLADKAKLVFKVNTGAAVLGLGYIVGLKYALYICFGSLAVWWLIVPGMSLLFHDQILNQWDPSITQTVGAMSPEMIFRSYARSIGIGGIAMAGIIGIIRSWGIIRDAVGLAARELKGKGGNMDEVKRTQRDISFKIIAVGSIVVLLLTYIFFLTGVMHGNLVFVGLKGYAGMLAALIMGGVVCTALSMAGSFITDLKIGYWLGTTPRKQESWKFLGTLVSAATVGGVMMLLNETYGFASGSLAAPQANAMAAVIDPLMNGVGAPWILYGIGALLAIILTLCKVPALAFALGMFIPLELNVPLVVGGAINWWVTSRSKDAEVNKQRGERGTLIASGFIAGGALMGVVSALLKFAGLEIWLSDMGLSVPATWLTNPLSEVCSLIAYIFLILFFVRVTRK